MDLNRLIQMLMRMFMRKAVQKGIRSATDYASRRSGSAARGKETPSGQAQSRGMKDLADKARKASRLGRRL